MEDFRFKVLTQAEEKDFREWAREFYPVGSTINEVWHPVVRQECLKINKEWEGRDFLTEVCGCIKKEMEGANV
mgnify:CR=1 FL=1